MLYAGGGGGSGSEGRDWKESTSTLPLYFWGETSKGVYCAGEGGHVLERVVKRRVLLGGGVCWDARGGYHVGDGEGDGDGHR